MNITEKIEKYLINEEIDIQKRVNDVWGNDPNMSIIYKHITSSNAWIVVLYHKPTKKYYGIDYMDEIIEKTTYQKAKKWVSNFMGEPVTFPKA